MLKQNPTSRLKRRYILIYGNRDDAEKAILDYIGVLGWSKAAPVFLNSNAKIIIAVNRSELENVKAALALSANSIKVVSVSGTLKGLESKKLK